MRTKHTPATTFLTFKDRIDGNGVVKLDRVYPSGASWIYIDRKNKVAFLAESRQQAREVAQKAKG
jgi:hypothetical protein